MQILAGAGDVIVFDADTLGFTSEDIIASWLPLYHDMGLVAGMLLPLLAGATVVMMDPFEWLVRPHLFLEAIDQFKATFCWLPNFAFERMAAVASPSRTTSLASLRAVINCSEPCKRQSQEKFVARYASAGLSPAAVQVSYAMAENVFAVTQTPLGTVVRTLRLKPSSLQTGLVAMAGLGEPAIEVVSCGHPLPRTSVRLVNEQREAVGDGCMGEIVIRTPTLFDGYYHRPELTKAALVHGWYYTGDIGFMHADELYVVGRVDDLLIIRGRNFVAHELEQEVRQNPGHKAGSGRRFLNGVSEVGHAGIGNSLRARWNSAGGCHKQTSPRPARCRGKYCATVCSLCAPWPAKEVVERQDFARGKSRLV